MIDSGLVHHSNDYCEYSIYADNLTFKLIVNLTFHKNPEVLLSIPD